MAATTMANKIQGVEDAIGYHFNDSQLLWEALSAPGCTRIPGTRHTLDGNRRLAMLGDSILKFALLEDWYASGQARGSGNQLVATIGSNSNLDSIGRAHSIEAFINSNPAQYGIVSPNTMAATVEAMIAAAYLDGGIGAARTVLNALGLTPTSQTQC